jgi:hypothetical protein
METLALVGDYKLFSNNCTTMVSDALNKTGSQALTNSAPRKGTYNERFIIPVSLKQHLYRNINSFFVFGHGTTELEAEKKPKNK